MSLNIHDGEIRSASWEQVRAAFTPLQDQALTADNLEGWLASWTALHAAIDQAYNELYVENACDTESEAKEKAFQDYVNAIQIPAQAEEQKLKRKLADSGLVPADFAVPLRNIRAEIELFREKNQPLKAKEHELRSRYNKITGAQTVTWDGEEKTLTQLLPVLQESDRTRREQSWRLAMERRLADRAAINALWAEFLAVRLPMAANADLPDFRAYAWKMMGRFDYTPADCRTFHDAIERTMVPAAERVYEKRRRRLGLEALRPWDLDVDATSKPPLRPFADGAALEAGAASIFHRLDGALGDHFETMRREKLLDLENRKGKAPGGFCTGLDVRRRPYIFMNAVGLHNDVQTLLHEAGHAFHAFAVYRWPYFQQWGAPMEFCEVASMSMELLAGPHLSGPGAFYNEADAARARIEHLEEMVLFWPYMAVVDAFQHWVYENPAQATDAKNCDAAWGALWDRFMKGVDWSGLDDIKVTGWHRKLHIHLYPFYYVEYGLAQLGAAQVWIRSLDDPAGALAGYRRALAKGAGTLPDLFAEAGARFAFDADILGSVARHIEQEIDRLEIVAAG